MDYLTLLEARRHNNFFTPVFEGDSGDSGDGGDSGDSGDGGDGGDGNKAITQEQLNKIIAAEKRKYQTQNQKALDELNALKAKSKLTNQEREELEQRIETLQQANMTKEELAKKELKKKQKKYEQDIADLTSSRDEWQRKYTDSNIVRTITDVAVAKEALVPSQLVAILRPNTRLVEGLDEDGKPNGILTPTVKFNDVDDEGKNITLDLTVDETIKRMRELPDYQNLFKGEGVGGLGKFSKGKGGKVDLATLAKDPVAYRKAKEEGLI